MMLLLLVGFTVYAQELRTTGMASCYTVSQEGMQTASGEVYAGTLYTGCHATLPFGTIVRVTNLRTSTSVLVKINDRFAHKTNRLIDVSNIATKELQLFDNIASEPIPQRIVDKLQELEQKD